MIWIISSCCAAGTMLRRTEYGRPSVPDFLYCCNEPSRAIWLRLMSTCGVKTRSGPQRGIVLRARLESIEEIARLMTMKPRMYKRDELQ